MNLHSSRSTPAFASGTDDSENFFLHTNEIIKSYTSAWGKISNIGAPARPSNQPSMAEKDRGITEFCGLLLTRANLQSMVATALRRLNSSALGGAMMQGVRETLTEAVDPSLLIADNGL